MDDRSRTNLVFLVSQPRAGSTMLQRMLGNHADIATLPEPWFMLHLAYGLRKDGLHAEYQAAWAREALSNFLQYLPEGEDAYWAATRAFADSLYGAARRAANKAVFLDKTPRYFLILEELERAFPDAVFLVLIRHPLAVLVSIFQTWVRPTGDPKKLSLYALDLLEAPVRLAHQMKSDSQRTITVRYEHLVTETDEALDRVCDFIGVRRWPGLGIYGDVRAERWAFGDQTKVYRADRPLPGNTDAWISALSDPELWWLARDYASRMGPDLWNALGYPYAEVDALLSRVRPRAATKRSGPSFMDLLGSTQDAREKLVGLGSVRRFASRAWRRLVRE